MMFNRKEKGAKDFSKELIPYKAIQRQVVSPLMRAVLCQQATLESVNIPCSHEPFALLLLGLLMYLHICCGDVSVDSQILSKIKGDNCIPWFSGSHDTGSQAAPGSDMQAVGLYVLLI